MPRLKNWKRSKVAKEKYEYQKRLNMLENNKGMETDEKKETLDEKLESNKEMETDDKKETLDQKKPKNGKKTFKLSFDVEKFLDLKIGEIDIAANFQQELSPLFYQFKQTERSQKEISRRFTEVEETLQQLEESLEVKSDDETDTKSTVLHSAMEEVIIDDSDEDDIVFIEATKQPSPKKKQTTPKSPIQGNIIKRPPTVIASPTGGSNLNEFRAALAATLDMAHGGTTTTTANNPVLPTPGSSTSNASDPTTTKSSHTVRVLMNGTEYCGIRLTPGIKLLGKKFNDIWYKGTLTDVQNQQLSRDQWRYRVKFDGKGNKVLSGRHLAYWETPENMIKVGSRVVALYRDEETTGNNSFYAGIVAEPLSVRNNHRLLVFFDDGYAQYCSPKEIHKVCEQSKEVWKDIHPDSHDFIRDYIKQYPERPMVRLQQGQVVKTEWNGRWWTARVMEVDASLAKMFFDADKRTEWIYRGSTRLEPLYKALCKAKASELSGKARRNNANPPAIKGVKKPVVEYMRVMEENKSQQNQRDLNQGENVTKPQPTLSRQSSSSSDTSNKKRSVAKKSTGGKSHGMESDHKGANWQAPWLKLQRQKAKENNQNLNRFQTSSISNQMSSQDMASVLQERLASTSTHEDGDVDDEAQGERTDIASLPARDAFRRKYIPHKCSRECNDALEDDPKSHKGSNPLLIPMLCGWERQVTKTKPLSKRVVMYKSPCGRRFRNIDEVDRYLLETECHLTIDLFCFDPVLHTDKEFVPVKTFCDIKDLSYGKETVPISCVNGIDRQYPDYVEYSNQRTPCKGVNINLDEDFLICCDCTDGCRDKSKCACCQMTIAASSVTTGGRPDPSAGYQDRRLKEPLLTGIYECNPRCNCDSRCHNRVAQNGLALRLQVFKTENRGWGLRCLDDIPCGGFLCIYAGQLLTEQGANEDGQTYGDEYLAELDYMEVVERHKEGYESDIPESDKEDEEEDEEDENKSHSSDSDYDGGLEYTAVGDVQELRTLPARNRGANMKLSKDQKTGKLNKLVLRRDSANQEKEWTIKTSDPKSEEAIPSTSTGTDQIQQVDLDDELPDLDTVKAPKESRVKNLPNPNKTYVRAHRSMVSAQHDHSRLNDSDEPVGTRHYFHDGQQCYVMDAKSMGNIGRYLNHSCSPNVFVQNVFVDTHDLRFPWVAFFAGKYIRQGTELTWDYNYEVGSVPGKILYCYCGSAECRGRLL